MSVIKFRKSVFEVYGINNLEFKCVSVAEVINIRTYFKVVTSIETERVFFSLEYRVQFFKTYIQPHIDYCSTVWVGTSHSNLNTIYRLQKGLLRSCATMSIRILQAV